MKVSKRIISMIAILSMILTSNSISVFADSFKTNFSEDAVKVESVKEENIDSNIESDIECVDIGSSDKIQSSDSDETPKGENDVSLDTLENFDSGSEDVATDSEVDLEYDDYVDSIEEPEDDIVYDKASFSDIVLEDSDDVAVTLSEENEGDTATESFIMPNDNNEYTDKFNTSVATESIAVGNLFGEQVDYTIHFDNNLADYDEYNTSEIDSWFTDQTVTSNENGSANIFMPGERFKIIEKTSTPGISRKFMYWTEVPDPAPQAATYHEGNSYNFTASAFTGGEKIFYAHWSIERYHVVLQFDENLPVGYELYANPSSSEFYPDRDWDLESLDSTAYVWTDDAFPFGARTSDHSLYRQHLGWSLDPNSTTADYGFGVHIPATIFSPTALTKTLYAVWSDPTPQKKVTYYWLTDQYDTSTVTSVEINMDNLWDNRFNPQQASGTAGEPGMVHRRPGVLGIYEIPDGESYNPYGSPNILDIRGFKELHPEQESFDLQFWCQQNWYNGGHPTTDKKIGVVYLELDHFEVEKKPDRLTYDLGATFDDVSGLTIKRYWKRTSWTDTYEYGNNEAYKYPGDFIFTPALNSTLPSDTPRNINVTVKFNPTSSTIYPNTPYESTNGGFTLSVGNNRLKLKLLPADKGTFTDTSSNEISFVTTNDFNNFKSNVSDKVSVVDKYQYIYKWSDGTNNNIDISNYNWNGINSFELTTELSPLLYFEILDADSAKGSITSTKTIFNYADKTALLNNGVNVTANTNYHFLGWAKEGTDTVVALNDSFWNEFIANNAPMKMVAKFADVITYRLVYDTTAPRDFTYNGPELQEVTRTSYDGTFDTPIVITDLIDTDFYVFHEYYGYARKRKFKRFYSGSHTFNPGDQITEAGSLFGSSHTLTLKLDYEEYVFASNIELKKYENRRVETVKIYYDDPNAENTFLEFINSIDYDNFVNDGSDVYAYNCFYTNYNHYSSHQYKWDERDQNISNYENDRVTKDEVVAKFYDWHTHDDDHHNYEYGVNYKNLKESGISIVTYPTTNYDIGSRVSAAGLTVKFEYWNHSNETFSYDSTPEVFSFSPELSTFGYNIVRDEQVSVIIKGYTQDALKFNITVDADGEGAYLLLNHGAKFDNGGAAMKFETVAEFNEAKTNGVNITPDDGYQNLNRWTSDGTTFHSSLSDFSWDGTGSLIINNFISTTVSFDIDDVKGSIVSNKLIFNDEESALFEAADFSVTPTLRWVFSGYSKDGGTELIAPEDITWANSYNENIPVVYTAKFIQKEISSINILTMPKSTYIEEETFDPSGLVIKVIYTDGGNETVSYNDNDFELLTTILSFGMTEAKIKFLNKEFAIPITVAKKTATNVSLVSIPTKTTYYEGESLDPRGLTINVTYDNGTSETITYLGNESLFEFEPSLSMKLYKTDKTVEITYLTFKLTFEINVIDGVAPTPRPNPPSGGGNGGSGGGGSTPAVPGPLQNEFLPAHTKLNINKVVLATYDSSSVSWHYNPDKNKWSLSVKDLNNNDLGVVNGFYNIKKTHTQIINGSVVPGTVVDTYYFDASGNMITGFITTLDNNTYCFEYGNTSNQGAMIVGWKKIENSWYYFGVDGMMYKNMQTPDGFFVGADGVLIN